MKVPWFAHTVVHGTEHDVRIRGMGGDTDDLMGFLQSDVPPAESLENLILSVFSSQTTVTEQHNQGAQYQDIREQKPFLIAGFGFDS
jgi:hypothetical protein